MQIKSDVPFLRNDMIYNEYTKGFIFNYIR